MASPLPRDARLGAILTTLVELGRSVAEIEAARDDDGEPPQDVVVARIASSVRETTEAAKTIVEETRSSSSGEVDFRIWLPVFVEVYPDQYTPLLAAGNSFAPPPPSSSSTAGVNALKSALSLHYRFPELSLAYLELLRWAMETYDYGIVSSGSACFSTVASFYLDFSEDWEFNGKKKKSALPSVLDHDSAERAACYASIHDACIDILTAVLVRRALNMTVSPQFERARSIGVDPSATRLFLAQASAYLRARVDNKPTRGDPSETARSMTIQAAIISLAPLAGTASPHSVPLEVVRFVFYACEVLDRRLRRPDGGSSSGNAAMEETQEKQMEEEEEDLVCTCALFLELTMQAIAEVTPELVAPDISEVLQLALDLGALVLTRPETFAPRTSSAVARLLVSVITNRAKLFATEQAPTKRRKAREIAAKIVATCFKAISRATGNTFTKSNAKPPSSSVTTEMENIEEHAPPPLDLTHLANCARVLAALPPNGVEEDPLFPQSSQRYNTPARCEQIELIVRLALTTHPARLEHDLRAFAEFLIPALETLDFVLANFNGTNVESPTRRQILASLLEHTLPELFALFFVEEQDASLSRAPLVPAELFEAGCKLARRAFRAGDLPFDTSATTTRLGKWLLSRVFAAGGGEVVGTTSPSRARRLLLTQSLRYDPDPWLELPVLLLSMWKSPDDARLLSQLRPSNLLLALVFEDAGCLSRSTAAAVGARLTANLSRTTHRALQEGVAVSFIQFLKTRCATPPATLVEARGLGNALAFAQSLVEFELSRSMRTTNTSASEFRLLGGFDWILARLEEGVRAAASTPPFLPGLAVMIAATDFLTHYRRISQLVRMSKEEWAMIGSKLCAWLVSGAAESEPFGVGSPTHRRRIEIILPWVCDCVTATANGNVSSSFQESLKSCASRAILSHFEAIARTSSLYKPDDDVLSCSSSFIQRLLLRRVVSSGGGGGGGANGASIHQSIFEEVCAHAKRVLEASPQSAHELVLPFFLLSSLDLNSKLRREDPLLMAQLLNVIMEKRSDAGIEALRGLASTLFLESMPKSASSSSSGDGEDGELEKQEAVSAYVDFTAKIVEAMAPRRVDNGDDDDEEEAMFKMPLRDDSPGNKRLLPNRRRGAEFLNKVISPLLRGESAEEGAMLTGTTREGGAMSSSSSSSSSSSGAENGGGSSSSFVPSETLVATLSAELGVPAAHVRVAQRRTKSNVAGVVVDWLFENTAALEEESLMEVLNETAKAPDVKSREEELKERRETARLRVSRVACDFIQNWIAVSRGEGEMEEEEEGPDENEGRRNVANGDEREAEKEEAETIRRARTVHRFMMECLEPSQVDAFLTTAVLPDRFARLSSLGLALLSLVLKERPDARPSPAVVERSVLAKFESDPRAAATGLEILHTLRQREQEDWEKERKSAAARGAEQGGEEAASPREPPPAPDERLLPHVMELLRSRGGRAADACLELVLLLAPRPECRAYLCANGGERLGVFVEVARRMAGEGTRDAGEEKPTAETGSRDAVADYARARFCSKILIAVLYAEEIDVGDAFVKRTLARYVKVRSKLRRMGWKPPASSTSSKNDDDDAALDLGFFLVNMVEKKKHLPIFRNVVIPRLVIHAPKSAEGESNVAPSSSPPAVTEASVLALFPTNPPPALAPSVEEAQRAVVETLLSAFREHPHTVIWMMKRACDKVPRLALALAPSIPTFLARFLEGPAPFTPISLFARFLMSIASSHAVGAKAVAAAVTRAVSERSQTEEEGSSLPSHRHNSDVRLLELVESLIDDGLVIYLLREGLQEALTRLLLGRQLAEGFSSLEKLTRKTSQEAAVSPHALDYFPWRRRNLLNKPLEDLEDFECFFEPLKHAEETPTTTTTTSESANFPPSLDSSSGGTMSEAYAAYAALGLGIHPSVVGGGGASSSSSSSRSSHTVTASLLRRARRGGISGQSSSSSSSSSSASSSGSASRASSPGVHRHHHHHHHVGGARGNSEGGNLTREDLTSLTQEILLGVPHDD